MRKNPSLAIGLMLIALLVLIAVAGPHLVSADGAFPLAAIPGQAPSLEYPFGTDSAGRDLLAVIVVGIGNTLIIGLVGGGAGVMIGTLLGLTAGYLRGTFDAVASVAIDVMLTVPPLLILVTVVATLDSRLSVETMAVAIAALSWMKPARQVRAQTLSLREAQYVATARISGLSPIRIILFEIAPNLIPYIAATAVTTVSAAILASIGLEAIGLGPPREPTLGMTIYWLMYHSAFMQGMWWWIVSPIAVLIFLFVGLFLVASGLDVVANPRLRQEQQS
jgi:peptide/nickel transport system permease protein